MKDCTIIRNNTEAVNLGQSQAPIYKNVVENSKMIEAVRKIISLFKLYDTNENILVADKTELDKVIDGVFNHLEWTVMLLDVIHRNSKAIMYYMTK